MTRESPVSSVPSVTFCGGSPTRARPQFAIPKNESCVSFRQSASGIVPGFCTEFDGTA